MGHYTYRELARDASEQGTDMHWTTAHKIVRGTRHPSSAVVRSLVRVLSPYLDEDEALIAAGFAPSNALDRLQRGESIEDVELEDTDIPWDTDLVGHAGPGGGLGQLALWPDRVRRSRRLPVKVSGDCMEPKLHHGDRVIVDLDAQPENKSVVFVLTDDGWAFRRYHIKGTEISFTCDNPGAGEQTPPLPDSPVYRVIERRERL